MFAYHYNGKTKEFTKKTKYRLDPLDKKPMIPSCATTIEPPAPTTGKAIVYAGSTWEYVTDLRGTVFYIDGKEQKMDCLGELPENALLEKPFDIFERKKEIIKQLKVYINDKFCEGYTCSNGIKMDAHLRSINLFRDGLEFLKSTDANKMTVTTYDNEHPVVTIEEAAVMLSEISANYFKYYWHKQNKRAQIESCETEEDLNKIDITLME